MRRTFTNVSIVKTKGGEPEVHNIPPEFKLKPILDTADQLGWFRVVVTSTYEQNGRE